MNEEKPSKFQFNFPTLLGLWMSTGYPEKSRDQKIPGLRNPGILIPEKSRDKKSRD
jgi:hypothetical protein